MVVRFRCLLGRCAAKDSKLAREETAALAVWEAKRKDLMFQQLLIVPPEKGALHVHHHESTPIVRVGCQSLIVISHFITACHCFPLLIRVDQLPVRYHVWARRRIWRRNGGVWRRSGGQEQVRDRG